MVSSIPLKSWGDDGDEDDNLAMNLQSEKTITIYLPIYFEKGEDEKERERIMFIYKIFLYDRLYAGIRPDSLGSGSGLDAANAAESQSWSPPYQTTCTHSADTVEKIKNARLCVYLSYPSL
jgi:hypothetical protein